MSTIADSARIALLAVPALGAAACASDAGSAGWYDGYWLEGDPYAGFEPQGTDAARRIEVESDPDVLASRLVILDEALPLLPWDGTAPGAAARDAESPSLRWLARIEPPWAPGDHPDPAAECDPQAEHEGTAALQLQANHVFTVGDIAVVSYHQGGEVLAGAIDVIDVSMPEEPVLLSSATFQHLDVVGAFWEPGSDSRSGLLYVAATTCDPCYAPYSALVERIRVDDGIADPSTDRRYGAPGLATVGVAGRGDRFAAATGETGGVTLYSEGGQTRLATSALADVRGLAVDGSRIAVLTGAAGGSPAAVHLCDAGDLRPGPSTALLGLDAGRAHATVTLAGDLAVAAIGSEGVQVVDLRAQSSVAHVPMPTDTGYDPEDVATNAVSVEGDLLVASGGGVGVGLIRADRPLAAVAEGEGVALTPLGRADLPGSVNHSTLRGESIFVAAGAAGFAVLRLE